MEKKRCLPIMVIGFAVLIVFLNIVLLNRSIRPNSLVALGTLLTDNLMEVRSNVFKTIAYLKNPLWIFRFARRFSLLRFR